MRRALAGLLPAAALAACVSPSTTVAPVARAPGTVAPMQAAGLDRVLGHDRKALVALFGAPDQDLREMTAHRLQFASTICVLDVYLYPAKAGAESLASYVDARTPQGDDIDRASCIAALSRRSSAR